jgi:hypothetical protein
MGADFFAKDQAKANVNEEDPPSDNPLPVRSATTEHPNTPIQQHSEAQTARTRCFTGNGRFPHQVQTGEGRSRAPHG